ncbi:MAG: hypothetical protein JNM27_09755, partial [Leptospirales bacterium]|nr:hypothetical protein [Leptospirales bacterium]
MKPPQHYRLLLCLNPEDSRTMFRSLTTREAAEALQEILKYMFDDKESLLSPSLQVTPPSLSVVISQLFKEYPYRREVELLNLLEESHAELAWEIRSILPQLDSLFHLTSDARKVLLSHFSAAELVSLRALFVLGPEGEVNQLQADNFDYLYKEYLSSELLEIVNALIEKSEPLTEDAETTIYNRFRSAISQVLETLPHAMVMSGG